MGPTCPKWPLTNNVDFGYYIEDILTRIVNGEEIDESFIPCNYVARPLKEESVA